MSTLLFQPTALACTQDQMAISAESLPAFELENNVECELLTVVELLN
jgi:hypothetical protein